MTDDLVESALRGTYQLAGNDAVRLRRLTKQSGLDAENVLSRLAIIRSVTADGSAPFADYSPSSAGRTKEIKGSVLLGRPRQAALMLALLAHHSAQEHMDLRTALTWHWARGLRLLEAEAADGDVLQTMAVTLYESTEKAPDTHARRIRRSGLGSSIRDELAAMVSRRFPRWPTEVCRLVTMAARLDPAQVDTVAERLATEAGCTDAGQTITETAALRIVRQWGLNRLGLTDADRRTLRKIVDGEEVDRGSASIPFLKALGLVSVSQKTVRLSESGSRLGEEAIQI